MPPAEDWWRLPDPARIDPRRNTGGNIDWFPPVIQWVKTMWYHQIPLKETKIQTPLLHLRNYMPDMNVVLQERRLVPLFQRAISFLEAKQTRWHTDEHTGAIVVDHVDPMYVDYDEGGSGPRTTVSTPPLPSDAAAQPELDLCVQLSPLLLWDELALRILVQHATQVANCP